jgi:hypothetical protein
MQRTACGRFETSSVKWFFDSKVLSEQERWRNLIEEVFCEENGGAWGDLAYTLQLMRENADAGIYVTKVDKPVTAEWLRARGLRVDEKNGKYSVRVK